MNKFPIILTSSVLPMDSNVKLMNPEQRLSFTLDSISQWFKIDENIKIVICDGSKYDFSKHVHQFPKRENIECLNFLNNSEKIRDYGKGYGEGEIIKFALENSKTLESCESFIKCTGKLWVSNFQDCINGWGGIFLIGAHFKNAFSLRKTQLEYLDTRFYISEKSFYIKNLLNAHLDVDEKKGNTIEKEFLKIIKREKVLNILFKNPPIIHGVGGGSGMEYKNSYIRICKDKLRYAVVKSNSCFKNYFTTH